MFYLIVVSTVNSTHSEKLSLSDKISYMYSRTSAKINSIVAQDEENCNKKASTEGEEILKLVFEAKCKLDAWVNGQSRSEREVAFQRLGMNEGLYTALKLATMDKNCDRTISDDEIERFKEDGEQLVKSHLESLMNGAIVTALIFSTVYPLAYGIQVTKDFEVLEILEYITLQIAILGSICSIFIAACMYTQIAFFLPTTKLQLWYVDEIRFVMPILEAMKNTSLILIAFTLTFHQLNNTFFPLSILSILPALSIFSVFLFFFVYVLGFKVTPRLESYAKELIVSFKKA